MGELDARVLAPLYTSADRRVRRLVRISKQRLDIAVGVHVSKYDPNVSRGDQGVGLRNTKKRGLRELERSRPSSS